VSWYLLPLDASEYDVDGSLSILIVDSNPGFAQMLRQALEEVGPYRAVTAESASQALSVLGTAQFDLAVVDLGLTHPDGVTLARLLRREQPGIRLMVIPLVGEDVPAELGDLEVQGVLPKPFFFPELAARFQNALQEPVTMPLDAVESIVGEGGAEVAPIRQGDLPDVLQELDDACRDLTAEALLLSCGAYLIAQVGRLSTAEAGPLIQVLEDGRQMSLRLAEIIGRHPSTFEQCLDGGTYTFYALAVTDDVVLSAVLPVDVPLGMVRHRARRAVEKVRRLMDREESYVRE
jgi:CheY-like chemotaxis protein